MLNLPKKSIETIKKYLLKRQREVEKQLHKVEEDDPATSPALAETSEPGTDSWLADAHNRTIALKNQLIKSAQGVRLALLKIRKGNYEKCDNCKKDIEPARLEAMPTATLCLSCSKRTAK